MFDGGSAKTPIDIEHLLRWAYAQDGVSVSYRNGSERALAANHGYTAVPKGCHHSFAGGEVEVSCLRRCHEDAKAIVAAVEELDPWSAGIVARNAKAQRRPDCFVGVEAREVEVKTYPKRGGKKGRRKSHRPVITTRWEPAHPAAICAAREIYARWHVSLGRLAARLDGRLTDWSINGFLAAAEPWNRPAKESA